MPLLPIGGRWSPPKEEGGQPYALRSGLWQIGSQAWHILVDGPDAADESGALFIIRQLAEVSGGADGGRGGDRGSGSAGPEDRELRSQREKVRRNSRKRETSFQSTDSRGKLDVAEAELEPWDTRCVLRTDTGMGGDEEKWGGWCCRPSCIPISIILVLIVLVVLLPLLDQKWDTERKEESSLLAAQLNACHSSCRISLVESIPEGVEFPGSTARYHPSTFSAWKNLLQIAERSVEIASFYWTLRRGDVTPDPSAEQGEEIFQSLLLAGTKRGLRIRIAQNYPTQRQPNVDTEILQKRGAAEIRSLNFPQLVGGGVLHTKFWLVDRKHFYVGSANMDWRSLTQVKEMGAAIYNCSCLAADIGKIFDVYWLLGQDGAQVPPRWPDQYSTLYGRESPMNLTFNNSNTLTYLSSSPPSFCPKGRTEDLDAILDVIKHAEKFVYVAVMDYYPLTLYTPKIRFWPKIDDALRAAAIEQKVKVRLLVSVWNQTQPSLPYFLRSLTDLSGSYIWVDIQVDSDIEGAHGSNGEDSSRNANTGEDHASLQYEELTDDGSLEEDPSSDDEDSLYFDCSSSSSEDEESSESYNTVSDSVGTCQTTLDNMNEKEKQQFCNILLLLAAQLWNSLSNSGLYDFLKFFFQFLSMPQMLFHFLSLKNCLIHLK